ncbi:cytochrome c [Breoghania sp.]|uniref:c-type cytochrome n=1 Tax=Breoghania sp. TaxID=2065378 RepID=UPI0029CA5348|nr:cytochrome c [Breoghania sp.]
MRLRSAFLFTGLGALAFSVAALAQGDPIKQRQEAMKAIGGSMKVLGEMAKGVKPYDGAAAEAAVGRIHDSIDGFTDLFPEGTEMGGDTEASPAIWDKPEEFKADAEALKAASAAAKPEVGRGLDALRASLGSVGGACKDCHQSFRIKKD